MLFAVIPQSELKLNQMRNGVMLVCWMGREQERRPTSGACLPGAPVMAVCVVPLKLSIARCVQGNSNGWKGYVGDDDATWCGFVEMWKWIAV